MYIFEVLLKYFIFYNVKFFGSIEVEQLKGIEVVRDVVRKLKFVRYIKKFEGQKIFKVEL